MNVTRDTTAAQALHHNCMCVLWSNTVHYAFTAAAILSTPACLIVDRIDFSPETNSPPSIVSSPAAIDEGTTLGEIVFVDISDSDNPNEDAPEVSFPVFVRDPNISQNLVWRVYLDYRSSFPVGAIDSGGLAPTADRNLERPLTISVSENIINGPGCHKIELLVSTAFVDEFPQRQPELEGDLGLANWWLYVTDITTPNVDFISCP